MGSDKVSPRVRVIPRRAGKPLWQYSSIEQLFRAMLDVVKGVASPCLSHSAAYLYGSAQKAL